MEDVKTKLPAEGSRIHFWVDWGHEAAPFDEMRSFLSQSILWTIRVRSASVKQISDAVQSHPAYVRDAIHRMVELDILKEVQRDRYIAADFFFDAAAAKRVRAWAEERGIELARRMMERMPDIHALFEGLPLHPKGVGWDEVAWPLIGFGFVKPSVTKCVTEPIEPPLKPSGKRYFFQGADFQEVAWRIIGCNMHTEGPWAAMQYWSPEVHPPKMGLPKHPAPFLEPLVENLKEGVAPDVLLERRAVADEMELARLIDGGILASSDGRIHLALPYLPAEEWETLRKDAEEFMEPLREDICEMLQGAEALLDDLRFEHLHPIYPEGKNLLGTNVAGECMMALKDAGALPEVPKSAPDAWGTIVCERRSC